MLRTCSWVMGIVVMCAVGGGESPKDSSGWRGNCTGLWPEAKVPTEWSVKYDGMMAGLRCANTANEKDAQAVTDGFLRHWLVIGPFDVADSVNNFDMAHVGKEESLSPKAGDTAGGKTWTALEVPVAGRFTFAPTDLEWVDMGKAFEYKTNQMGYAQTYVFAAKPGKVRAVVEHNYGLQVWCNGKEVYKNTKPGWGVGNYPAISRQNLELTWPIAPCFDLDLQQGMNRLTMKVASPNREGWRGMQFSMWLRDMPGTPVIRKNMKWRTELPARSSSTPILVGERLYLMAEPDELVCLHAKTGKILWTRYVNYYEAMTPQEKAAKPEYAAKVDPLVASLKQAKDEQERLGFRRQIDAACKQIEPDRFKVKLDGHLAGHFGIVGFTTPMPCSDGKNIYVFVGTGVAARFDLDGNRKWISRLKTEEGEGLAYPAGGAVIGGKFVVFIGEMIAFDSQSGKEVWRQPKADRANGSLLPAKLAGVEVVLGQRGEVVRASDGKLLWDNPDKGPSDSGWNPSVVIGDVMYLPWQGTLSIKVLNFSKCTGDQWQPERGSFEAGNPRGPDGKGWQDKWSAGSPLVWQDMLYMVDMYGTFIAVDLKTQQVAYRQNLDTRGLQHYNAMGVVASPTLMENHIYVFDNQGTGIVLEPGRQFKQVAINRIESQLERTVAIPPQEILTYSAPVADGKCFFLRGEKYLYCVGE